MKKSFTLSIILLLTLSTLVFNSCKKASQPQTPEENTIEDLLIPADFDFATTSTFQLTITDYQENVKYDIYSIKNNDIEDVIYTENDTIILVDDLNQKVASGFVKQDAYNCLLTIPSYHSKLYLVRSKDGYFSGRNIDVSGSDIDFHFSGSNLKSGSAENDLIYVVSSANTDVNTIDVASGVVTKVGNLPFKSIANAIDLINNRMYTSNNKSPYQYGYFDLNDGSFTQLGNMPFSFPRMDYNHADGMLYISNNTKLYKVDPSNAQFLQTYSIVGFGNSGWGDVAFTNNGTLYFATKDGIYEGTFAGTTVNVVKLSDNSMPNNLTSIAAGSNGNIYTTTGSGNKIIDFNPTNGVWAYLNISQSINRNDFAMLRTVTPIDDTDGDGVPDDQDEYPTDHERAFNNYFPGEDTWATLAYEDLWPSKGDYDFNDLVLGYNINQVTNGDNNVVEIFSKWDVRHNGAGFENGFAFEIGVEATNIETVTGYNHTSQHIPMNSNGTEAGQTMANFVVFDETLPNLGQTLNMYIKLINPSSQISVGPAPYNPYVIVNGDTEIEVHLPDMENTELANTSLFGTYDDTSNPGAGRYYKASTNLPWAINIVYDFVWMKEKQEVTNGYLKFGEWAESGGTLFQDWYKDLPNYRDDSFLDYQE